MTAATRRAQPKQTQLDQYGRPVRRIPSDPPILGGPR